MIAKQQTKLLVSLQRTLYTQREAIEKIRDENATLRESLRSAQYAKMGGGGNDGVAHVLGAASLITQKMKLEEEIRACLDALDGQRIKIKEVNGEIKSRPMGGGKPLTDRQKTKYANR